MKKILNAFKQIDYRLFVTLLLFGFLPTVYTTVRIFFLGDIPTDWGVNIASQLSWVNIIYEVIQEAILLPIFYLLGKSILEKDIFDNKIKTGFIVTFIIYTTVSIFIISLARPLMIYMSQKNELIMESVRYIRFESVASIFNILVQYLVIILVVIKKEKYLLIVLISQMLLTIISDTFMISSLPISLNIGVIGIAYGNIWVNIFLLSLILIFLRKEGYFRIMNSKLDFSWMKEWIKVGSYSGIESFVRNLAFMVMILKMVNEVGEQGVFWVANNFIWGWLLLPILQLGQVIKRDCGEQGNKAISEKSVGYFLVTTVIVLFWIISIPLWKPFIKNVMNVVEYVKVFDITIISIGFYILFAYNNVIDSIFYGIGKTNYMLFQSVIINTLFYGILFILYRFGIYKPTLNLIVLMFAMGIGIDALLTFGIYIWMLKKRDIKIVF